VTAFKRGQKPPAALAYEGERQNRYRTTLTHEYGHVHFHAYLFEIEPQADDLFKPKGGGGREQVCKRDGIINARQRDWMEWQAGYVCAALLMPVAHFRRVVSDYQQAKGRTRRRRKRACGGIDREGPPGVSGFRRCRARASVPAFLFAGSGPRPIAVRLRGSRRRSPPPFAGGVGAPWNLYVPKCAGCSIAAT
jgi:hypothetical protein